MKDFEILQLCETLTSAYREVVVIDPSIKITYKVADIAQYSQLTKSSQPLTWEVQVSAALHQAADDVKETVIDALAGVMLNEIDFIDLPLAAEIKSRLQVKIRLTLLNLIPDLSEDDNEVS